eukprot:scaffold60341_cov59-Attheya_sp.AAC.1
MERQTMDGRKYRRKERRMTPDTGASDKSPKGIVSAKDKKPAETGEYKRYFKRGSKKPSTNVSTPAIVIQPKFEGMIPELK